MHRDLSNFGELIINNGWHLLDLETQGTEGEIDDVGYTGHKFDKALGLSYMQARYYDPIIGRFYGNDPVDVLGHMSRGNPVHGFGRFTYVNNNPYKYIDPDGEFAVLVFAPEAIVLAKATLVTAGVLGTATAIDKSFDAINQMNESGESTVEDLDLLHGNETLGERPDIAGLSDEDLLDSVNNPSDSDDPGLVVGKTGKLKNGNSRARELKNRARDPNSKITDKTKVPVTIEKNRDSDYFPDLD